MSEFDIDIESMLKNILEGGDPVEASEPEPVTPAEEPQELLSSDDDADDDAIPTIAEILGMEEPVCHAATEEESQPVSAEPEHKAVQGSPNTRGTATEDSRTPAAGDGSELVVDGSTTSESNDGLHACKSCEAKCSPTELTDGVCSTCIDKGFVNVEPVDESMWSKEVTVESITLPDFTSDDIMAELDIRNYGTLVSLSTLRWHAKVRDHSAALNAANATGADAAAYEARKRLLVGADEKLKRVHTAIDAARTEHYRLTLPWSTVGVNDVGKRSGPRLLPNTLFFDYTQKMAKFKQEMIDALDAFVQAYPTLIAIAQKKLGKAFDHSEYPAPSQIRSYFDLSFQFDPVPVGSDFNNVQIHQAEKLAMSVNKRTRQMLENAMQDAWKRLLDDMQHAYNSLSNPNAKFHYTLIEKMKEHSSMLSHLNATKDPRIEAIRQRIEKDLAKRDIKDIRKDDGLRKHLADEAKAVLDMMQEYANDSKG